MELIKELLFPSRCVLCRRLLRDGDTDLCVSCRKDVPRVEKPISKISFLDSCVALWHYEDKVRSSLHRFKFRGKRCYASNYGRLLAMKLQQTELPFDVLTWVPISRRRKWRRGYDQVEILAKSVGRELGVEAVCTLKRVRHAPPQSGIFDPAKRRANVLGVYRAVEPEHFSGKRVLLLDDIVTTGATLSECARVLLTAGALEVRGATVASARK